MLVKQDKRINKILSGRLFIFTGIMMVSILIWMGSIGLMIWVFKCWGVIH